ncbi:hypothetical protein C0584_05060 [Candidatus Parcubacteria bacterium]|nr:MAG: hypothetical protein C0584_05060 [Candidatus Parcubacteria bacterium]
MGKSLVLGNGNTLIGLDNKGQLVDFYYHKVGMENHVGYGNLFRIGVRIDGDFSWFNNDIWKIKISYKGDSLTSNIEALNEQDQIKITINDVVDNKRDVFVRRLKVKNLSSKRRDIKLFFTQQFKINATSKRDTGYYDSENDLLIHYKGRRVFATCSKIKNKYFDDYTVGNYGIDDKEGAWKDAEDGELSKCNIEHGSVDSVIANTFRVSGKSTEEVFYWITTGKSFKEAIELSQEIEKIKPEQIIKKTSEYWKSWVNKKDMDFADLDDDIKDFYKTSLLMIRTHTGNSGEIIASGDSDMYQYGKDTYAYVWPRDGAFVSMALDLAGYGTLTRNFFDFCVEAMDERGFFYHKYLPDRSVGSSWHPWTFEGKPRLAIQEDETALILCALDKHYEETLDMEYIAEVYPTLIKPAAEFMCNYRDKNGMPLASYDLWEQDYATHTFTCATVYGGLMAASKFAHILGKDKSSEHYASVAWQIKKGIMKYLFNKDKGYFYKSIKIVDDRYEISDVVDISSFYAVYYFSVLEAGNEKLDQAFNVVLDNLSMQTPIGGTSRYVGDNFHRVNQDAPSNPWYLTTFWRAQYQVAKAKSRKELSEIKETIRWAINLATPSKMMAEQVKSDTGEQISASPLTWSHAELVSLVLSYIKKYKELK